MFNLSTDDRLSAWSQHRLKLDKSVNPLQDVWEFWKRAPYIPYNNKIDPYYQAKWPNPWEIIVENKYDDFTKALMISWTLKLTNTFKNIPIELRIYIDNTKNSAYNVAVINNEWAINFVDSGPIILSELPETVILENIFEIASPR